MKINTTASYNLDMLCLLNTMTADPYYADRHKAVFERFYPLLRQETRDTFDAAVKTLGFTMLAPTSTLFISSLNQFNERPLTEMLACHDEIKLSMKATPYHFSPDEYEAYFRLFSDAAIPMISELETLGIRAWWTEHCLPAIESVCAEFSKHVTDLNLEQIVNDYKNWSSEDLSVYVCAFVAPHGIKLCGNRLITDVSYRLDTILSNITHEIFHPPYDIKAVADDIDKLAAADFIVTAFENQDKNSGYRKIQGFIEENIVEALGIFVLVRVGVDLDPFRYFVEHDSGSHVLSPHFYRYLDAHPKHREQAFEDYFSCFVKSLQENKVI